MRLKILTRLFEIDITPCCKGCCPSVCCARVSPAGSHPDRILDHCRKLPDRRAWGHWDLHPLASLILHPPTHLVHSPTRQSVPPSVSPSPCHPVSPPVRPAGAGAVSVINNSGGSANRTGGGMTARDEGGAPKERSSEIRLGYRRLSLVLCVPESTRTWRWRRNLLTKARLTAHRSVLSC